MTWTGRRLVGAALTATLALGATACGGDDKTDSSDEATPTTASSDAGETSSEPTDDESTATTDPSESTPGVAPATGIELKQTVVAINAPEGWEEGDGLVDYASAAEGPRSDLIYLIDNPSLASPDATIDSLYDAYVRLNKGNKDLSYERQPDIDLAGTPASVVLSTTKGSRVQEYDVKAVHNGRVISVSFQLDKKTVAKDPQLVESVLASFRWLD